MKTIDHVTLFEQWFSRHLVGIRELKGDENTYLFRHTLYLCLLETLSNAYEPNNNKNRDRFTNFVKRFCDWQDSNRVSLPVLLEYFQNSTPEGVSDILQHAEQEVANWQKATVVHLDRDPNFEDIRILWQTKLSDKAYRKNEMHYFTHVHLLWEVRNFAVHQSLIPTGTDHLSFCQPYYVSVSNFVGEFREYWALIHPLVFLDQLCETAIKNLVKYFRAESIDPYSNYKVNAWSF